MYNHYIPGANGTFQRTVVDDRPPPRQMQSDVPPQTAPCAPAEPACEPACERICESVCDAAPACAAHGASEHFLRRLLPRGIDLGELLALLVVLLLLVDSEEDDTLTVLVTIAVFLLL